MPWRAEDLETLRVNAARTSTAVDNSLAQLVAALQRVQPEPDWSFVEMRDSFAAAAAGLPVPAEVEVTPVDDVGVAAEVIAPEGELGRTTLYLHGGAYTIGSIDTARSLASQYAVSTRSRCLVLDYRLAPEHPHPAAVEDAVAAFTWMADRYDSDRLVVAGDSAGGGLAIATANALVALGGAVPDAVVAMSPWTDLALTDAVDMPADGDPQAPLWMLRRSAAAYLAGAPGATPSASPVRGDVASLPPTLVHVGSAEPLYQDALRFAAAAFRAGGPVTLDCWPGMIHVWHAFAPRLDQAQAGLAAIGDWLDGVV